MYLSKILHLGLLLLFSLIASSIHADQNDPLEIIDLNNRPAEEMIPIIKVMLKPNDAITGTGFQLFLRTDEKTLEEVTRLLQVMDRAPRSLIISVRNNVDIGSESSDFNYSGNYEIGGDTRVVAGERPPHDKGKRVRTNNSKRSLENNSKHMVRVTESRKAFIIAGEIRSYENRNHTSPLRCICLRKHRLPRHYKWLLCATQAHWKRRCFIASPTALSICK